MNVWAGVMAAGMAITSGAVAVRSVVPCAKPTSTAALLPNEGDRGLWVVDANGSNQRRLGDWWAAKGVAWSPDGARIAFGEINAAMGPDWLAVVNVDGSGYRRVTGPLGDGVAWSPDGTKIVFVPSPDLKNDQIFTINADGSGKAQLTNDPRPALNRWPAWSPDGTSIAFTALSETGQDRIEVVNTDGTGRRVVASDPDSSYIQPSWSPDGTEIAFVDHYSDDAGSISVVQTDGTGGRRSLPVRRCGSGVPGDPAWSPDGTKIATGGITVVNAGGSSEPTLLTGLGDSDPAWSPDSTKLAFFRH